MQKSTNHLPTHVAKYFWGDNLQELNWIHHRKYILGTLLDRGDKPAIDWLFTQMPKKEILNSLPQLKLTKKSANFWSIYLS